MEKPLLIIADPNNDRADAISSAFNGDLEIMTVRDAFEAHSEIRSRKPIAVVVDFPFPMNGRCLSTALSDDPLTASIPVIAFSGWDFPRTRAKAREYGCTTFIPHAHGPEAVVRAVGELLEARA